MRIESVNVGRIQSLDCGNRVVDSAIVKRPVAAPVRLDLLGLDGDAQADRRHHGGGDKAVNVYPYEHYAFWQDRLERDLPPGSFGENLTTSGLLEDEVAIGDVYRIGDVQVQVTQPRQPCFKLAGLHRQPQLIRWVEETGYTGFYVRCLQPGMIQAGDSVELIRRLSDVVTIRETNGLLRSKQPDAAALERLIALPELSEATRRDLERRRGAAD